MTDIFLVSHGEPNAIAHWERLKSMFPRAKRVDGVKGIHTAHKTCAAMAETNRFVVVDADNWVIDDFDPTPPDMPPHPEAVYVWRARNPLNGLVYGHGAIKSFPTALVHAMPHDSVDMTTSTSLHYRIVHVLGSEHRFNTSKFETWRTAFRECVKLSSRVIHRQKDRETTERLDVWCTQANGRFSEWCLVGARDGRAYGEASMGNNTAIAKVNDWSWLNSYFLEKYNGD